MPELPEVKNFTRYIKATSLHKKITDVTAQDKRLIKEVTFSDFKKHVIDNAFEDAIQRGKYTIISLKKKKNFLIMHFGMTGSVHYIKSDTPKEGNDKYTKVIFKFSNDYELRWINKRKFGALFLVKNLDEIKALKTLGPDPLSLTESKFLKIMNDHERQNIKSFLMDQKNIAGIGNEYSDEILYQAKINPHKSVQDLNTTTRKKLFKTIKDVLKEAIDIRMHDKKFDPKKWLIVHRKKNGHCPKNSNHKLKNETIAGRSSYWCPICQKK
ncbi:MAG: DNA-formamidopyrimidine glycosylase family protein [Candidatus Babeliales bacterium]